MMSIGVGGAWVSITPYIGVGGSWKQITGAWVGVGGQWRSLTQPAFSATVAPTSVSAQVNSGLINVRPNITTPSVTVTPSGGSGSYSYSWSVAFVQSGSIDSSGTCSANSPSSATTTFTGQTCAGRYAPGNDNYIATCVITDNVSGSVATVQVSITITNYYVA